MSFFVLPSSTLLGFTKWSPILVRVEPNTFLGKSHKRKMWSNCSVSCLQRKQRLANFYTLFFNIFFMTVVSGQFGRTSTNPPDTCNLSSAQLPDKSIHNQGLDREEMIKLPENVTVPAVIAFGDSFMDSGNNNYLETLAKANFYPYGKDFMGGKSTGRFTNGKTLADLIAEALGVKEFLPAYLDPLIQDKDLLSGVSFASGGTGYDPLTPKIASVIPLSGQLDMFKEYIWKLKVNVGEEAAKHIITNSLFLVVASTNDFGFNYADVPIRRLQYNVPDYANMLIMFATNFIQEIYKLGARRIGVFSAPPVGCLPAQRTLAGGICRTCVDKYNKAAQLYNMMLKQQLQFLDDTLPQSRVAFVDFYNPVISIIENPHHYGLEVADKGCCGTGLIEVSFLCNKFTPTCSDVSKFFFWDSFHPTEQGYKIIVNQVLPDLVRSLFSDDLKITGDETSY